MDGAGAGAGGGGRRKRSAEDAGSEFEMSERPLRVKLLPGERVKGRVAARRCNSPHTPTAGVLLCTNFRVAFIPPGDPDPQDWEEGAGPLGENEVALTCIERLVAVSSSRSKVVTASSSLKFQPEEVVLHCRDLRLLHLQLQPGPHSRQLITTIAQNCRPDSPRDLFVFDYALEVADNPASRQRVAGFEEDFARTQMFDTHLDWERELARTGAHGWRVSLVNERFEVSDSLSKFLVVPRKILDLDLKTLSAVFTAGRIPRWHWHHAGSNLLRMGSFLPGCAQRHGLGKLEELVSGSQGWLVIADLSEDLPSPADIQQAYQRLRGLCTQELPGAPRIADEKWLSTLEATRWLDYVRLCLKKATEVSALLWNQRLTVTLQESDDRDVSCLVSSLVQLMLDPACRTLTGFQSLVQKEWVSAGHRFSDRLNYLHSTPRDESPVFLLFLDCVWQLCEHYPFAFEFTDVYLLAVHSATHTLLSGTFLFNCCREQVRMQQSPCSEPPSPVSVQPNGWSPGGGELVPEERVVLTWGYFSGEETPRPLPLPSAWDWSLLHSAQQQRHHRNILYSPPPPRRAPPHPHTTEPSQWRRVHVLSRGGLVSPGHALPWKPPPSVSRRLTKWSRSLESLLEPEPGPGAPREPGLPSLCPSSLPLPSLPLPAPSLGLWKGCYLRWDPKGPETGQGPRKRQWASQRPGREPEPEPDRGPDPESCQGGAVLPSSRARLGALWSEVRRLGRRLPGDPPANGPRRHGDRGTAGIPER